MSSLKDKKSDYWNTRIDTAPEIILDHKDSIDRLLINTDFDTFDIPDITANQNFFVDNDCLVDIKTTDHFQDLASYLLPEVEKTSTITSNPIIFVDDVIDDVPDISPIITTTSEAAIFAPDIFNDKDDTPVIVPLDAPNYTESVEIVPSLVQDHAKVQKISLHNDAVFDHFKVNQPLTHEENKAPQPQNSVSDKQIQTSVTITSTVSETVHNSEWTVFKAEQDAINTQYKKRILELEKTLRKAMLFSLLAALVAGISLIAAVSGLL